MEYQMEIPEAVNFVTEESKLEIAKHKMRILAEQKFPIRKYNEFTENYAIVGEQAYEDALRDAYEELETALDNMIGKIRENIEISSERMADFESKVEYFKLLLPD